MGTIGSTQHMGSFFLLLMFKKDILGQDEKNHGATICPIILGSDKTTVSVATGQNEYYPLYMSNGLIHNNMRRAHKNGVSLVGFLAIPKSMFLFITIQSSILTTIHFS